MLYDVHLYVTCRAKVWNVEAESQLQAIEIAADAFEGPDGRDLFPDTTPPSDKRRGSDCCVEAAGYADEITGALVDEVGDEDYENSRHYEYPLSCTSWQKAIAACEDLLAVRTAIGENSPKSLLILSKAISLAEEAIKASKNAD